MTHEIQYHPPDRQTIHRFVCAASKLIAQRSGDDSYLEPEIISGLTDFLQVVAAIEARRRSMPSPIDNDQE